MGEMEVGQTEMSDLPTTFDQSVVLLDVRENDEWQRGHAAGALHIPMGEVCHLGGRSLRVARYLARNGYAPINVNGGMQAWADAGRPVITDDGGVGTI